MSVHQPTVAEWDPDVDGPLPLTDEPPTPEYALKFLLNHLRAGWRLDVDQHTLATVEYVTRQALGQADPLPRYSR
jgi:hypothetical protein